MKKTLLTLVFALLTVFTVSSTSYAGTWKTGQEGYSDHWWYAKDEGGWLKDCWEWIDGNKDGIAECYCFDKLGWLYQNCTTPDGFTVDKHGAWTIDGAVQKKNITSNSLYVVPKINMDYGEWVNADNMAQLDRWAEAHKKNIAEIEDPRLRYNEVVKEVTEFLEFDARYKNLMLAYGIRDRKGTCVTYSNLVKALCNKVGIECHLVIGTNTIANAGHMWNRVKIGRQWYYSDISSYEFGFKSYKLSLSVAPGFILDSGDNEFDVHFGLGTVEIEPQLEGMVPMTDFLTGVKFYVYQKDYDLLTNGQLSYDQLKQKYGIK